MLDFTEKWHTQPVERVMHGYTITPNDIDTKSTPQRVSVVCGWVRARKHLVRQVRQVARVRLHALQARQRQLQRAVRAQVSEELVLHVEVAPAPQPPPGHAQPTPQVVQPLERIVWTVNGAA